MIPLNSPETGGRFRVWLSSEVESVAVNELLWDRKTGGGFPEPKVLVNESRNECLWVELTCGVTRNKRFGIDYSLAFRWGTLIRNEVSKIYTFD